MSGDIFDLVLNIDSTEEDRQEVRLVREEGASDSATLEWPTQTGDAGDYTAEVVAEGQDLSKSVSVTVKPPFTSAYTVASLASFGGEFGVGVFKQPGGALQYELEEQEDVDAIAATSDTLLYVKRSVDTEVQRADIYTGAVKNTYTQASDQVATVELARLSTINGTTQFACYGGDGADVYVHDTADDSLVATFTDPSDGIEDLDSVYDILAVGDGGGTGYLYNLGSGSLIETASLGDEFADATVAINASYFAGGEQDIIVYDLEESLTQKYTLTDANESLTSLEITKGGASSNYLLAGTNDSGSGGEVWVWDLSDGSVAYDYTESSGPTVAVSIGPDNFRYISEGQDASVADTVVERSLSDGSIQDEFDLPSDYSTTDVSSF